MVTPGKSFAEHVGLVVFPRSPADLTSTTICPACFTSLTSTRCTNCGLDVTNPAATELHETALAAAAALDHRIELIGRIRFETAAAASVASEPVASEPVASEPVASAAVAASVASGPVASGPVASAAVASATAPSIPAPPVPASPAAVAPVPAPSVPAPSPVVPGQDAAPSRHFGVQVVLLIVGVSLLAIGAIFFLVYAFITFGLVWRSVIIGAVTVAAFVGAALLKRRRLGATAEAIAALAVVFVYLDAFAIRANDLFGAGSADGLVYWGSTLLVSAVGFEVWHRLSGLRLPSVVAFAAAGPGLAFLVAGLSQSLPDTTTAFAAFAALAAGGLTHPLAAGRMPERAAGRMPERVISLVLGVTGLAAAGIIALFLEPEQRWAAAIGLGIVALLALLHVFVVAKVGSPRLPGLIAAGIGALAASIVALVTTGKTDDFALIVLVPPIAAAVVTLALEFTATRLTGFGRVAAVVGAWAAAGVTALTLVFPLVTAIGRVARLVAAGGDRWSVRGGEVQYLPGEARTAVIGLAVVVALAALSWLLSGRFGARAPALAWAGLAVAILAVPLLGMLWLIVLAWLLLGAAAVAAIVIANRRGSRGAIRVPLAVAAIAATTLAYFSSWASIDTWWYGSIGTVALLAGSRVTTKRAALRGTLLGLATILGFVAIGSEGWHTNERFQGGQGAPVDSTHFVIALAILLIVLAGVFARVVSAFETRVLFWLSFATAVVGATISWALGAGATTSDLGSLVLPEFGTSSGLAAGLVLALAVWGLLPRTAGLRVERLAAHLTIAPAAAWLADSLARAFALAPLAHAIAPTLAALVVAAVGLAIALLRPAGSPRWALDGGVALVAVPAILVAVASAQDATGPRTTWLVLLLGAVTALLLAISADGIFGSTSPRKHLGWVALAFAAAGRWWRLGDAGVTEVEPYTLPLAGALLIIAVLVWRAGRPGPTATAPLIALAGLAVGMLPSAIVATSGPVSRALVVAGIGAVLLLVGSILGGEALRPYRDAAALAGGLAVVITAGGRAAALAASRSTTDPALDAWLAALLIVLVAAALAQARQRPIVGQLLLGIGLVALLVELFVLDGQAGTLRAAALLVLYGAVYVVGLLITRAPFTPLVGWGSLALGGLVAVVAVALHAIDPLEWATAALSAALLLVGAVTMRRSATAGSWAWLAPGLLVLLIPSLFATFVDQPLLRLVGLGVVCIIAIVVGAIARLQAPLVIGAVIVLVHAIRTFSPQIAALYQLTEWWVWAVIGGAIVLFLGLTFEKRMRDLKATATRVAALR